MHMAHKPEDVLKQELAAAAEQVEVGALYAHYKHPELPYLIKGLAILESTEEVCVLYEAQHSGITFIRPLSSWLETAEWEGVQVPRFGKI